MRDKRSLLLFLAIALVLFLIVGGLTARKNTFAEGVKPNPIRVVETNVRECYGDLIKVHLPFQFDKDKGEYTKLVELKVDPETWYFEVKGQDDTNNLKSVPCLPEPLQVYRAGPVYGKHFETGLRQRPRITGFPAYFRTLSISSANSEYPVQRESQAKLFDHVELGNFEVSGYRRFYGEGQTSIEGLWGFPETHPYWRQPVIAWYSAICDRCLMECRLEYRYRENLAVRYQFVADPSGNIETGPYEYQTPDFVGIDKFVRAFIDQWIVRDGTYKEKAAL